MEFKVGDEVRCEERFFSGRVVAICEDPDDEPYVVEISEGDYRGWFGNDSDMLGLNPDKRHSYCSADILELTNASHPRIKTTFLEGIEL